MRIYLDNAATTKIDEKVLKAVNQAYAYFGNPSSLHSFGQESSSAILKARDQIADFLNCESEEIIFTSGGSESDNLAIKGIIEDFHSRNNHQEAIIKKNPNTKYKIPNTIKPHVIVSAFEHHAVLHTVEELEKEGKIEATYIKPDKDGIVAPESIVGAVKDNTILVSLMYVNNEIGTVQPIKEVSKKLKQINQSVVFHTDAVQAAEFMPMDVKELGVDLLTLSGHKFHGPRGIGLLYVKKGTKISPQILGGKHERGLRAGTENLPGIVGLAKAMELFSHCKDVTRQHGNLEQDCFANARNDVRELRDKLENWILENISDTRLNGSKEKRAPHISNISFLNAEGEAIILNLDFEGIAVSSGSACTSRSLEPSHVLTSMGVEPKWSHGAIRFSLSRETTESEIDKVIEVLPPIIEKLRAMSPFGNNQ